MPLQTIRSRQNTQFIIQELKNLTSEMSLIDDGAVVEILLCERSSVTLQVSKISGLPGHLVSLKCIFQISGEVEMGFAAVGKISEVKTLSNGAQEVTIKINQYDSETWGRIVDRLGQKQHRIDTLFSAMKGEDQ